MIPEEGAEDRGRGKGFKARKREDHALVLIRELLASLDNPVQARRLLLELSRYYDPILGGAIVEVRHQRRSWRPSRGAGRGRPRPWSRPATPCT